PTVLIENFLPRRPRFQIEHSRSFLGVEIHAVTLTLRTMLSTSPVNGFVSCQRQSIGSTLRVTRYLPSRERATAWTGRGCSRGGPTALPVAVSQRRAVPSSLAVATVRLSELKATCCTDSRCTSGRPSDRPVAADHSRAVRSLLPVITVSPSGLM